MPTTPTLVLCNDLVAALVAAWEPTGSDGAERAYFKRIADAGGGAHELLGRRVVIYPSDYSLDGATRGEDEITHTVTADVFERYAGDGDPPTEWTDERVDFVWTRIVKGFDFGNDGPPAWNPKLVTRSVDVSVCDVNRLVGSGSLFFSRVELVFAEVRAA